MKTKSQRNKNGGISRGGNDKEQRIETDIDEVGLVNVLNSKARERWGPKR